MIAGSGVDAPCARLSTLVRLVKPDLDDWLPDPSLRVSHRRGASVGAADLWRSAREVRLRDTRVLGRLIRWRIPGVPREISFDELFRSPPFTVLSDGEGMLVSGLVGRIWTLRRDYPTLSGDAEFRVWSEPGTARVLFASWVEPADSGGAALRSEARVSAVDRDGRIGLTAVRPLVAASQHLIASEGIEAAVRLAEQRHDHG
ncbi:MAG: hypothetical protein ACXVQR_05805 [Solirubrobacteraceae bacterium]